MTDHPKRPRDPNQLAKWMVLDIATGQAPAAASDNKDPLRPRAWSMAHANNLAFQ